MAATPHIGTPPVGAPEDAFRNVHRDDESRSGKSHSNKGNDDEIAQKIESYQKELLLGLSQSQRRDSQRSRGHPTTDRSKQIKGSPKVTAINLTDENKDRGGLRRESLRDKEMIDQRDTVVDARALNIPQGEDATGRSRGPYPIREKNRA